MSADSNRKKNRLAGEKSPYLLKHADNPVDWRPWGEEAFEAARLEDKPVFLSIGYSTCHWCNVMEEESFSDPEVAALMNDAFVPVKVDREERPDIDNLYMSVCIMLTGSGGWPLTVVLTPDRKPFFAGTYFPREGRFGRPGMMELVPKLKRAWKEKREAVTASAENVLEHLKGSAAAGGGPALGPADLDAAYAELAERFDAEHGGFGPPPKFPAPHNLFFLLRYWKRTGDAHALDMVKKTLLMMRAGGMFDQLGFGFHRYSTDERWLLPHFEKMLYDQALLAMAYTEAHQATGDPAFGRVAREIFAYVLRDMTAPGGGFCSAEGADSEGEEGKFYLWDRKEIESALGPVDAGLFCEAFGVRAEGNFVDPLTGGLDGRNILHIERPHEENAPGVPVGGQETGGRMEGGRIEGGRIDGLRKRLLEVRAARPRPDRDDKVLADWNGLMIAALAQGVRALGEAEYLEAAKRAAGFVLGHMRAPDGGLFHRWREGSAAIEANAADYAFIIWGLIELYGADHDAGHLEDAVMLMDRLVEGFWDEEEGGFFFTRQGAEGLILRLKEIYDGAVPSANSVAMLDLLRLGRLTANPDYEKRAARISEAFAARAREAPSAYSMLMSALDFGIGPTAEVVVVGRRGAEDTRAMLKALGEAFLPRAVVLFVPEGEEGARIGRLAGYAAGMTPEGGKATAHVCRDFRCGLPTTDVGSALRSIGEMSGRPGP